MRRADRSEAQAALAEELLRGRSGTCILPGPGGTSAESVRRDLERQADGLHQRLLAGVDIFTNFDVPGVRSA